MWRRVAGREGRGLAAGVGGRRRSRLRLEKGEGGEGRREKILRCKFYLPLAIFVDLGDFNSKEASIRGRKEPTAVRPELGGMEETGGKVLVGEV